MPREAEREPTAAEIRQWREEDTFAPPKDLDPQEYPGLRNVSTAHRLRTVIRPLEPTRPEFATLREPSPWTPSFQLAVMKWNSLWEAGQFRRRFFQDGELLAMGVNSGIWPTFRDGRRRVWRVAGVSGMMSGCVLIMLCTSCFRILRE
ncbi:hypothetical protein ACTD5D_21355 [Nocardia takedensis]|uniref:hypothetical protein n=1 Tax=Nocardia takedensis TaxID=259390 RepID=UPI003F769D2D